jgi:hypothetical protein
VRLLPAPSPKASTGIWDHSWSSEGRFRSHRPRTSRSWSRPGVTSRATESPSNAAQWRQLQRHGVFATHRSPAAPPIRFPPVRRARPHRHA